MGTCTSTGQGLSVFRWSANTHTNSLIWLEKASITNPQILWKLCSTTCEWHHHRKRSFHNIKDLKMLQEFIPLLFKMFYKNLNSAVETVRRKTLPLYFK